MRDLAPAAMALLEGAMTAVTVTVLAPAPCSPPPVPVPLQLRRIGCLVTVLPQQERRVLGEEKDDILSRMALAILLVLLPPSVAGGDEEGGGGALGEGGCGGGRRRRRSPVRAPPSSSPPSRACQERNAAPESPPSYLGCNHGHAASEIKITKRKNGEYEGGGGANLSQDGGEMDGAVAAAERKRSRCELTPFLLSASFLLENRGP
jgi:hypothetical protein